MLSLLQAHPKRDSHALYDHQWKSRSDSLVGPAHEVESDAIRQLKAGASLPWVAHYVAVMPDVHVGKGAMVGSLIALHGAGGVTATRPTDGPVIDRWET